MATIQDVLSALDRVIDPCSQTTNRPMSIVTMGLVDEASIVIDEKRIEIALVLTDPLCAFFRDLAAWIQAELCTLGFESVAVSTRSDLWTPSRINDGAVALIQIRPIADSGKPAAFGLTSAPASRPG